MKLKDRHPSQVALAMMSRSICAVQVGACLVDSWGIYAWGWNSSGSGFGMHAEEHCLKRSNRDRWADSILYVAAQRRKSGNVVTARPCVECQKLIRKIGAVIYRDGNGEWTEL